MKFPVHLPLVESKLTAVAGKIRLVLGSDWSLGRRAVHAINVGGFSLPVQCLVLPLG